jgi:translation initiation factor IF-3
VKEIQFRPNTGDHDVKKKIAKINEILEEGEDVVVVVKFKGREKNHAELGTAMLQRVGRESNGKAQSISTGESTGMRMVIKPR